jgi:hypothetical protein
MRTLLSVQPTLDPDEKDEHDRYPGEWRLVSGVVGAALGLFAGFFLFVWSYRPLSGLGNTPVWQVSLADGGLISVVGLAAFWFRKKSGFVQGIFIAAVLVFIANGLCGLSGR